MKTVLITGISKGIGAALAEKFLDEGYFVIGTSVNGASESKHDNMAVFSLDLASQESIDKCVKVVKSLNKTIDIFINNAGVLLDEEETSVVAEKLRKTLEINLIGTIDFTEKSLPMLCEGAHIVNISSTAGSIEGAGHPGSHFMGHYPAYKISKTALNMYTRTLALRLGSRAIVSSVHPGWVKTDMGGQEADVNPDDAAENIYKFAVTRPETGNFWFNGDKLPW